MRTFVQANTQTKAGRVFFYSISLFLIGCFFSIIALFKNPSGISKFASEVVNI